MSYFKNFLVLSLVVSTTTLGTFSFVPMAHASGQAEKVAADLLIRFGQGEATAAGSAKRSSDLLRGLMGESAAAREAMVGFMERTTGLSSKEVGALTTSEQGIQIIAQNFIQIIQANKGNAELIGWVNALLTGKKKPTMAGLNKILKSATNGLQSGPINSGIADLVRGKAGPNPLYNPATGNPTPSGTAQGAKAKDPLDLISMNDPVAKQYQGFDLELAAMILNKKVDAAKATRLRKFLRYAYKLGYDLGGDGLASCTGMKRPNLETLIGSMNAAGSKLTASLSSEMEVAMANAFADFLVQTIGLKTHFQGLQRECALGKDQSQGGCDYLGHYADVACQLVKAGPK